MKKQAGSVDFEFIGAIALFAVIAMAFGGWVANIVKFIAMLDGGVTSMFIARGVGIFAAPFGAILGYF